MFIVITGLIEDSHDFRVAYAVLHTSLLKWHYPERIPRTPCPKRSGSRVLSHCVHNIRLQKDAMLAEN